MYTYTDLHKYFPLLSEVIANVHYNVLRRRGRVLDRIFVFDPYGRVASVASVVGGYWQTRMRVDGYRLMRIMLIRRVSKEDQKMTGFSLRHF